MIELSKICIGNDNILDNLLNKFDKNSLPNSLIFSGPKGIGKATLAFQFITKLFKKISLNKNIDLIYKNIHPNVKYIKREYDNKSDKTKSFITIEQIRNLENFLYQSSFDNLSKFIIIDSVDDLNLNSSNSLLKILEEPKKNTYFILIVNNFSNISPTIKSRCVNFLINTPDFKQFNNILNIHNPNLEIDDINFLYNVTNSSPGLAISINSSDIIHLYKEMIDLFINYKKINPKIINFSNTLNNLSNDDFKIFLILLRYVLITITKINLGINFDNTISFNLLDYIYNASDYIDNIATLNILEYLNNNENELFLYNLDKKIFFLNIFPLLINNHE